MNITEAVFSALEKITGIERADLEENMELNLLENGILDSLSTVTLITEISSAAGKELSVKQFTMSDFESINTIIAAMEKNA